METLVSLIGSSETKPGGGYYFNIGGSELIVETLFAQTVPERIGQIWGGDYNKELANMWMATPQPGIWFTVGAFSQCRIFSKYLALQIKARELGLV